ncbi:GlxA family transcriptional regulator [Kitasatospora sp. NPDC058115]|uniref:GlxA family transcriptional regulator n=1 Tax=Kitasatospora sp. NPDC058115 TaxID=3346347 RepID=UPI0036D7B0B8
MPVIAVVLLDGVPGHHVTTPAVCFGTADRCHPRVSYEVRLCAAPGFRSTGGPAAFGLAAPWGLDGLAELTEADTVLVPGQAVRPGDPPPEVVGALRAAAARGCRIGAFGSGTFTLAATGLLDGRRASTARGLAAELARRHPRTEVDPDGAVVADGPFHTAAGVLGGVDLCLRLITVDHGVAVAVETERQVFLELYAEDAEAPGGPVGPSGAPGGPVGASPVGDGLGPTLGWLEARLDRPLTLEDIAGHAGLTVRALSRRFRAETGLPPLQYLLRVRIQRAQRLLERGDEPVARIAARTGLGTPANLRHHFQRHTGTTPSIYRAAFRSLVASLAGSGDAPAG